MNAEGRRLTWPGHLVHSQPGDMRSLQQAGSSLWKEGYQWAEDGGEWRSDLQSTGVRTQRLKGSEVPFHICVKFYISH